MRNIIKFNNGNPIILCYKCRKMLRYINANHYKALPLEYCETCKNSNMKLIICGPSASGKTHFVNVLKSLNYKQIIQHTNRPSRPNEINGVDYHFETDKSFYTTNDFIELQYFDYCDWYYGTTIEEWNTGHLLVVNPLSLKQIKSYTNDILVLYFDIPKLSILNRLKERNDDSKILSRLESDFAHFDHFNDYDVKITSSNFSEKIEKIINLIKPL